MFKLHRYFSLTSFIGISIAVVILSYFFRELALQTLIKHQTDANVNLTHSFANAVWGEFDAFVEESSSFTPDMLKERPELMVLHELARKQMLATNIVKIKVYNLNGLTVFSSDPSQIGLDKSANIGFMQAKQGAVASEIAFRNEFYAFEGVIVDRNIIASYIPIKNQKNTTVAVFEVYSDVTPLVEQMETTQYKVILGVLIAMTVLYLFLYFIVRRADNILKRQELERIKNEDKIRYQAYHDSLTGLPNRDAFSERIKESIKRATRHNKIGALMFLDLDRFKLINDSLGHDAGDKVLQVTAKRIQACMRETDTVFRLSGDEFVIILEDLNKDECSSNVARRILEEMAEPITLNELEVIVNISIGITTFPKDDADGDVLLKEADVAMYRAKEAAHNHYEFYVHELNTLVSERLLLETDLQLALQNDEFVLYYQTKVDCDSSEIVSLEALIRWDHPKKGIILPDDFIYLLEDMGLINDVGNWVLMVACQQAQKWIENGVPPVRMSVNVSAKQFRNPNLINNVKTALSVSGLDAKYLELELTESMFVENTEHAITIMHELKSLGLSLSIDDFGSGYSSLSCLKLFPVDFLKIDRAFIKDLASNNKDAAITTAIIALAKSLDLGLIGEGIENEEQRAFLQDKGCTELQGFLFSKPVSADELEQALLHHKNNI